MSAYPDRLFQGLRRVVRKSILPEGIGSVPSERMKQSVIRQMGVQNVSCVSINEGKCRYGFPQAFLYDPITNRGEASSKLSAHSFRLSCPHLVKALDEIEAKGGVRKYNTILEDNKEWQGALQNINEHVSSIRRSLVSPEDMAEQSAKKGPELVERILASGLAGITPGQVNDVKCLHAQMSYYLITGRENPIATAIMEQLQSHGIDVKGGNRCQEMCDPKIEMKGDTWKYYSVKNKSKLNQTRQRRRRTKKQNTS